MFDSSVIDALSKEERTQVVMALSMLSNSPIFELQEQLLLAQLAHGSESETAADLSDKVLRYRADKSRLLSLKKLGDSFNEERNDDYA